MLLMGVVACQSLLSPNELRRLAAAEHRWASRGFADYSIETSSSCFCPPEVTGWVRIEVVGGQIRKATLLGTGDVITDTRLDYWDTVEALFVSIRNASDGGSLAGIGMAFDPMLGFPTLVEYLLEDSDITDGAGSRRLRNAQALP